MSAVNCAFVTWTLPTVATSSSCTLAALPPPPPQPATSAATTRIGARNLTVFIGKRRLSGLARGQHSIDKIEGRLKFISSQCDLAVACRVDSGVDLTRT